MTNLFISFIFVLFCFVLLIGCNKLIWTVRLNIAFNKKMDRRACRVFDGEDRLNRLRVVRSLFALPATAGVLFRKFDVLLTWWIVVES